MAFIGIQVLSSKAAEEYSALNRAATAAKGEMNWEKAIALLQKAKRLRGNLYEDTRLAKFLQQAGRFDEAMIEIQWLIDHSHDCVAGIEHQLEIASQCHHANRMFCIHREAALICKREKRKVLQVLHESEYERWQLLNEKLRRRVEAVTKQRSREWKAARAEGPAAMQAYRNKWCGGQ